MGYIDRGHYRKIFEENGLGSRPKAVEGGCFPPQYLDLEKNPILRDSKWMQD
jgi:hypothetical protein